VTSAFVRSPLPHDSYADVVSIRWRQL